MYYIGKNFKNFDNKFYFFLQYFCLAIIFYKLFGLTIIYSEYHNITIF